MAVDDTTSAGHAPEAPPTAPAAPAVAAAVAASTSGKTLAGSEGVSRVRELPSHFPAWAARLAELYFSGTTSMFVLHGNVFDLVRLNAEGTRWGGLAEFLAEQLFGRWDLILHYDLARGLRPLAGGNARRLQDMVSSVSRVLGDVRQIKRDPVTSLAAIDLFVQKNIMAVVPAGASWDATPLTPKRKARKPITAPAAAHRTIEAPRPTQGLRPKWT